MTQISKLSPCTAVLKSDAPDRIESTYIRPKGLEQPEFMIKKVQQLLKAGLIERCELPRYVSAAFPVLKPHLKPGERNFRLVIDMRKFNEACVKTVMILPHLEDQ